MTRHLEGNWCFDMSKCPRNRHVSLLQNHKSYGKQVLRRVCVVGENEFSLDKVNIETVDGLYESSNERRNVHISNFSAFYILPDAPLKKGGGNEV